MDLFTSSSKLNHRELARAVICSLLFILSGCQIPNLRGPQLNQAVPETFNGVATEENSSQVPIEEFFGDPLLIALIDQAMVGNQELRILGEEIQIANNEIWKRSGAYLPFLGIGGGAGLEKPSFFTPGGASEAQLLAPNGSHFPNPLPDFMGNVTLSWQIDIWRQLRNARDAAGLRYLGTEQGRNFVITQLVAEMADKYFMLMALDKRLENLNRIIALQEDSLQKAAAKKAFAQETELAVSRFRAEIRRNQAEKLIVLQQIIQTENRINFLCGRFPQPVQRNSENFFDLNLHQLSLGVPSELLLNRPDIRQAELELQATGLDIKVARANFYPKVFIYSGVGWEAYNMKYLFSTPDSLIYNIAGDVAAPLINKRAIQADYMTANARQLQALYDYQRTILQAFTEVINNVTKVQNYSNSIEFKKQQLESLETAVDVAGKLFNFARIDYIDVLFAQRDLRDARTQLIDTKQEQLAAIAYTYQALGGGLIRFEYPDPTITIVQPEGDAVPPAAPGDDNAAMEPPPEAPPADDGNANP
ncbi:MAG TPA: TolC family protein [Planctomycetaceae bacterium]|nr:TolC family protein [Planctomycetaceae bacterium]